MSEQSRRETVRGYLIAAGAKDMNDTSEGFAVRCFFHDHRHRSKGYTLVVNVERGIFCCYSQVCGRSGTLATILSERLGWSWRKAREAQRTLCAPPPADAETVGVLPAWGERFKPEEEPGAGEAGVLDPGMIGLYDRCPTYMLKRGFSKRTLRAWDIGYDPESERVTFPVWSRGGELLGFTKRRVYTTDDPRDPAYKHLGFRKSEVLYGEHRVEGVSPRFPLIVHEGTPSVLWQWQAGVPNAVATLGSKVSDRQVRMMARYTDVLLCFDGDEAGIEATRRVLHGAEVAERVRGRWVWTKRPGLVALLERGRVRVVTGWPRGMKDLQELPQARVERFLERSARPWEEWQRLV